MRGQLRERDVAPSPPERVRAPIMLQRWDTTAFFHWRMDERDVRPAVPNSLEIEQHDGSAWVSLTPFQVQRARVPGLPPLPSMERYGETNLRTYVRGPDGRRGIWFFALDTSNVPSFLLGRGPYLQPYMFSSLVVERSGDEVRYSGRRHFPHRGDKYEATVRIGARIDTHDALDVFLTGRWIFFTFYGPVPAAAHISHQPWPLHRAACDLTHAGLFEAAGMPEQGAPDVVHFSPGVDARLGIPRPIRGRTNSPTS